MTIPLALLAFFSITAGYLGLPAVVGKNANLFANFLEPVIHSGHEAHLGIGTEWLLILLSVAVAVLGIVIAWIFYIKNTAIPSKLVARFPGIYKLLYNKYYVDEAYNAVIINPAIRGSELLYKHFDLKVIDGAINGTAASANFFGKILSVFQTGLLKDYALIFLLGTVLILGFLLF
jgi:NADH-quinone oxidoreductase subunit L